jgi:large subunit ribosomal protein L29
MKPVKWREIATDELEQKARELTEELFNLRLQLSMGVAKNPARVGQAKRDLARAKTVLRERALNNRASA